MECQEFQKLINDFIFDKIEYTDEIQEFIEHARNCKQCREDLDLYYSIHRGFGDVGAPAKSEKYASYEQEMEDIFSFYDEWFSKQKKMKLAGKISIIVCSIMMLCGILFILGIKYGYINL